MAVTIILRPVTVENWKACIALELSHDQQNFVPSNLYSIAEAQFYPDANSMAIYNEENQLVGYTLFGRDVFTKKWKVFRIMIDRSQQRKGYGRAALREIIRIISEKLDGNGILICYQNSNRVARNLYASLGFIEQDINSDGKVTALLEMNSVVP